MKINQYKIISKPLREINLEDGTFIEENVPEKPFLNEKIQDRDFIYVTMFVDIESPDGIIQHIYSKEIDVTKKTYNDTLKYINKELITDLWRQLSFLSFGDNELENWLGGYN